MIQQIHIYIGTQGDELQRRLRVHCQIVASLLAVEVEAVRNLRSSLHRNLLARESLVGKFFLLQLCLQSFDFFFQGLVSAVFLCLECILLGLGHSFFLRRRTHHRAHESLACSGLVLSIGHLGAGRIPGSLAGREAKNFSRIGRHNQLVVLTSSNISGAHALDALLQAGLVGQGGRHLLEPRRTRRHGTFAEAPNLEVAVLPADQDIQRTALHNVGRVQDTDASSTGARPWTRHAGPLLPVCNASYPLHRFRVDGSEANRALFGPIHQGHALVRFFNLLLHRRRAVKAERRAWTLHAEFVIQLLTCVHSEKLVLASNDGAQDISWCNRCTSEVVDPIFHHHEAEVLALVVDVHDVFTSRPNHVLVDKYVVDSFGQIRLDLDELFSFPREAMDGLATPNEELVLR
mmetsp:Transcript_47920/g.137554  ORF Transcript_47920/g.137554 Transcript_47920/m.137554 type:complete len:404 (-) Transcript_47920:314-1525(-)